MHLAQIASIARAENGWVITTHGDLSSRPTSFVCAEWKEVLDLLQRAAFPFPDKNEPRKP